MLDLLSSINQAAAAEKLLASSATQCCQFLASNTDPVALAAIGELVESQAWAELDNRFFRTLAFGTGGLRGKTIGAIVTAAEQGAGGSNGRPEHPCVGTNAINYYNLSRATQGLVAYALDWHAKSGRTPHLGVPSTRPAICIAHDTRHFSREFAEFVAKVIADLGMDALLFEGARSTPELSFAVRQTGAVAGINLTASHNPPEYNGYKVYFADGGQIVEPHAGGIIARVNAITGENYEPATERGRVISLDHEMDEAYLAQLETLLLDPAIVRAAGLRVVFSALHGVGGVISVPALRRIGCTVSTVASQDAPDGRFPTVKSPNPENAEALTLAMQQADAEGADLVLATDPDADRLGVAARGSDGALQLLTGNQLGSLMAWYRAKKFVASGGTNGVIIKTFVTTDLQKAIAAKFGVRCVETLTGFKYIGAKLAKYEAIAAGDPSNDGTKFVFGGEESYGYSGADFVRDKDANAAAVMLAEVAAFAKANGKTLPDLLDELFAEFGVHLEHSESLVMEGADGAAKIQALVESYRSSPPAVIGGAKVVQVRDFSLGGLVDIEGDEIPREAMMIFEVEGGLRIAVRPSGTEPKIKFYMFVAQPPGGIVEESKSAAKTRLSEAWKWLKQDADARLVSH
ncbi:MAG: phospho-sugar mutase [Chthoniobacterales bacterium]